MSTFEGRIKEINGISVDRFDGENMNSTCFFLSHCHSDHMRGLSALNFQDKLIKENKFLYLSNISAIILRALAPNIANQIKELPLEEITSIPVEKKYISVTCIPAGHCPGSVMFLFETNDVCVLYTGDYRISTSDITKFKCFYDAFGNIKPVHNIYLDTTFFMESYFALPKREDSLSELCKLILSWISQDPENCIKLDLRAKYGYEYVFKEIYNICKMPVHVDIEKFDFYSVIPELDKCVTTNGSSTRIHNCRYMQKETCEQCNKEKLRIIKLSAFRWENNDFKRGLCDVDEQGIFYVCYSTHASYQEGIALLDFLKPKDIHICVKRPTDPVADANLKKLVDKQLEKINGINSKMIESPKLFGVGSNLTFLSKYSGKSSYENTVRSPSPPRKFVKHYTNLDSPPR